jgi:DNA repair protein RadD
VRAGVAADNDNVPEPANDNVSVRLSELLDDEIPF